MKRKVGIGLGVVIIILGVGFFTLNASSDNTTQTLEEISGLIKNQYPGEITALQLKEDSYYEAVVKNEESLYRIKLDSKTGEVLHLEREINVDTNDDTAEHDTNKPDEDSSNKSKEDNASRKELESNNRAIISVDQAKEIALEQFAGTVEEVELDEDDGRRIYEIKIINGEDEAEIELDAYTGEIIVIDIDIENPDD